VRQVGPTGQESRTGAPDGALEVGCVFLTRARIRPHASGRAVPIAHRAWPSLRRLWCIYGPTRVHWNGEPGRRGRQRPSSLRRARFRRWAGADYLLSLLPLPAGRPSALCPTPPPEPTGAIRGSTGFPSKCGGRPEAGHDSKATRQHLCEKPRVWGTRSGPFGIMIGYREAGRS
jgi:hypothetical protein